MDNEELRDIVRVGKVHSVKKSEMTARVKFEDKGIMSGELHILVRPSTVTTGVAEGHNHAVTVKKWTPEIGSMVLCIMLPDGDGDGFIIGGVQ